MVSMLNYSLLAFFILCIIVIQAQPLHESSNALNDNKSANVNRQLYEIYKIMRTEPRLADISNKDLILFIHQNFLDGIFDVESMKNKYAQQRQRQQLETD
ncbi:hypothetical protein I4U23_012516 [Adineta vaga]|nr:hypothetical protein I4U23_012516 [Adineta vaga]